MHSEHVARSFIGSSGRKYIAEKILQEKEDLQQKVFLASSDYEKFVIKHVPADSFRYYQDMYNDLRDSRYVRSLEDTVPEQSMFVHRYYATHLLQFAQEEIAPDVMKRILFATLQGIAELHDKDIVHTDVKPNNVFLDYEAGAPQSEGLVVKLSDIEDAAYVPVDSAIIGRQVGNQMWRSPEATCAGPVQKPTDMFSFGLVCIYAMKKVIPLFVDETTLDAELEPLAVVIERQISYFGDPEGYAGLMDWVDGRFVLREAYILTCEDLGKPDTPLRPFAKAVDVDQPFKDFIASIMSLDPRKRLTAREALAHEWFDEVRYIEVCPGAAAETTEMFAQSQVDEPRPKSDDPELAPDTKRGQSDEDVPEAQDAWSKA